jgi:uncharacterized protein Yka (UPF0111/DUF47 family)
VHHHNVKGLIRKAGELMGIADTEADAVADALCLRKVPAARDQLFADVNGCDLTSDIDTEKSPTKIAALVDCLNSRAILTSQLFPTVGICSAVYRNAVQRTGRLSRHSRGHSARRRNGGRRANDALGPEADVKTTIWNAVKRFFGPSQTDRFAELLLQLADTAVAGAAHFRETGGLDHAGIIDYEHRGDAIVREIHELLDNAFILRFDIADSMRLADDVDNVIDGMRKVAIHIDIYRQLLAPLPRDAMELFSIGERMIGGIRELVAMLGAPRLSLTSVREKARELDEAEAEADKLVAAAERKLVAEYSPANANHLAFIAWDKLYQMLEEMTDEANHCGELILSLARKEA